MKNTILTLTLLLCGSLFAQQKDSADVKVGLVLSGGGAKGLAHIGALKVIEDAGVRIDYIGGTSMGAIIGGMYAAGYSAKQLDSIFNEINFNTLIQDDIPRSAKTFYEKNEADRYAVTLPFDGFKIGFPSGLSKGQNLYNLFSRLLSHVSTTRDFSRLPTPFFCIATDAESGKEIILDKGYLPQAISASGALPSLFSPVIINDTIMIDGGVTNNYPIDEVRAKGMDIIIGVDVQDSLKTRKQLSSAFDVLVQVNNYRTIEDMVEKRGKTDIYINPDIEDFSVVSFDQGRDIIEAGEEKTEPFKKQLRDIAKHQTKNDREKVTINPNRSFYVKRIEINGNENYTRSYILGKLRLKPEDSVSYKKFNLGINNLSATRNFKSINYRFQEEDEGKYAIIFDVSENESRTLLRLGAHYDDLYRSAALLNVTRKRLFTNNDIASLDVVLGDNLRYDFNYFVDKGYYWSIGLNSRFTFFDKDVPVDFLNFEEVTADVSTPLNQIEVQYSDFTNQLYFQTIFQRTFILALGMEHKWLKYISETIGIDEDNNPRTVFENTNYGSVFGQLKYDSYDNSFFPKEGLYFSGDFHLYLLADGDNTDFDQFSIAKAKVGVAQTFLKDFTVQVTSEGGFKIGNDATRSLDFLLGGYGFLEINNNIPFYGYEALSLRGDTYLKSMLLIDYEIFRKNHINIFGNIANVGDNLFESGQWIDGVDYGGFGLGYGLETFLGPIEVKYAFSPERNEGEWYVSAGFRF